MKVLYLNHNVVHTGTFVRAAHLGRELVAAGHEVTLITTSHARRLRGSEWDWHGVRVIEAPDLLTGSARTGWDAWNTGWRIRRLARERFDLIHAFDGRPVVILPALAAQRTSGAPLFMDWADWWGRGGTIEERSGWLVRTLFAPVETWFEERFRTGATGNTAIVESLRQRCIDLGADPARVRWLPNGCQTPSHAVPSREEARRRLGVAGVPLLLHLGVAFAADAAFLFEAFRRVLREQPNARLALVGRFASVVPADLRHVVTRTGFVDDTERQAWLAAADVGVVVLRDTVASRGRWPGKLSDYLTAGLPLVMPAVGQAAAYVGAAGAAALSAATPTALGDVAVRLLQDPAERSRMSEHARTLASGELAWSAVARELLAFYQGCGEELR
jgi:glycosyltransferase involved in cell wall biosynthesis